jgi:hypothetical protein
VVEAANWTLDNGYGRTGRTWAERTDSDLRKVAVGVAVGCVILNRLWKASCNDDDVSVCLLLFVVDKKDQIDQDLKKIKKDGSQSFQRI